MEIIPSIDFDPHRKALFFTTSGPSIQDISKFGQSLTPPLLSIADVLNGWSMSMKTLGPFFKISCRGPF